MNCTTTEVEQIFEQTGALTKGHFVLRSGLHSEYYFQCARVGEDLQKTSRLAELLIEKLCNVQCDTVLAPAIGALVIGQEVARQLGKRFIFTEKEDGKLVLRRGFKIQTDEKILIIEDVVTKGGRAQESINIVKEKGGTTTALAVLVDRSQGKTSFNIPFYPLMQMAYPTYHPQDLPAHLQAIPATKPGSA